METLLKELLTPTVIVAMVSGILVNAVWDLLKHAARSMLRRLWARLDTRLSAVSSWWRRRSEARSDALESEARRLAGDDTLLVLHQAEVARRRTEFDHSVMLASIAVVLWLELRTIQAGVFPEWVPMQTIVFGISLAPYLYVPHLVATLFKFYRVHRLFERAKSLRVARLEGSRAGRPVVSDVR